jgi:methionine-gamma-lyase
VESVGYLGFLTDDRQADIYRRHCTGAGSTFSLYLKGGEKEAFAFLDALKIAISRSAWAAPRHSPAHRRR